MQIPSRFITNYPWSIIPGPLDQTQPMNSQDLASIVELPAEAVAASFLAFPGLCPTHPPEPDWWAWRARWEAGAEFIALEFSLFEELDDIWSGSGFTADCSSATLLALLRHMNQRHPGIWLHDPDCGMHADRHIIA